ncbi:hypothetical protein DSECCO2_557340 [anaerobic digester metagenome]
MSGAVDNSKSLNVNGVFIVRYIDTHSLMIPVNDRGVHIIPVSGEDFQTGQSDVFAIEAHIFDIPPWMDQHGVAIGRSSDGFLDKGIVSRSVQLHS